MSFVEIKHQDGTTTDLRTLEAFVETFGEQSPALLRQLNFRKDVIDRAAALASLDSRKDHNG